MGDGMTLKQAIQSGQRKGLSGNFTPATFRVFRSAWAEGQYVVIGREVCEYRVGNIRSGNYTPTVSDLTATDWEMTR